MGVWGLRAKVLCVFCFHRFLKRETGYCQGLHSSFEFSVSNLQGTLGVKAYCQGVFAGGRNLDVKSLPLASGQKFAEVWARFGGLFRRKVRWSSSGLYANLLLSLTLLLLLLLLPLLLLLLLLLL